MPLTVTNTAQANLQHTLVEYRREHRESYYVVTDAVVINYFTDGMLRYRRYAPEASLQAEYWKYRAKALGRDCQPCGKGEVKSFAGAIGYDMILEPLQ
jgi:hypothetical protein